MKRNDGHVYIRGFAHAVCEWGYLYVPSNKCLQLSLNDVHEAGWRVYTTQEDPVEAETILQGPTSHRQAVLCSGQWV